MNNHTINLWIVNVYFIYFLKKKRGTIALEFLNNVIPNFLANEANKTALICNNISIHSFERDLCIKIKEQL